MPGQSCPRSDEFALINFDRKLPTEELDAANIVRGILKVQAAFAAAQQRPLGRGTHTKGICARATFEVFDIVRKVGDGPLAASLAQGIYARPGVYPATVRFANAASTIDSDRKPDLRALSFSVDLTPDAATGSSYQDYSLQSATTFPINDAHTFAVLMKVLSAGSGADKLKAIWSLSIPDLFGFFGAAIRGTIQQHGKTRAYQQMRYWSTVPFRNGPFEAVKYTAIPSAKNPAHELQPGPNDLQDELIRHLNEDAQMSSFDFALQLLDTDRMTRWGFRRSASFWVENASVEWKESQAPFYVVGRLTLLPKSILQPEDCEPRFIDVTEHSTPETQPLGSINRARLAAELASRKVRLGEATVDSILEELPIAPPAPRPRFRGLTKLAGMSLVAIFGLYFVAGFVYHWLAARNIPAPQHIDDYRYLNQGWGLDRDSNDRETFYYTPQGTEMHGVRYSWFINLEQPFSRVRLTDPDHMRALDFVVDPVPTPANPDLLPIGFARRFDEKIHDNVVDITCSACHTGQLNVTQNGRTTAIRIDGGAAMTAFTDVKPGSFQVDLILSIAETLVNPLKFNRFSARILGPNSNTLKNKLALWRNMSSVMGQLGKVVASSSNPHLYPIQEGYGRTDALTRIANVVFGDHVSRTNLHLGNGPVSYPYMWNIWKFNWEQYGASVSQPMARNVGEALGVGANFSLVDDYGRPIPIGDRYRTSVSFDNLLRIESTVQKLAPPPWPEDLLGKINKTSADPGVPSAERGKALFEQHCIRCHGPSVASNALKRDVSPGRLPGDPMWVIRFKPIDVVGTDPATANNFVNNTVDLTRTGITFDEVKQLLKAEYETEKARDAALIPALQQEIARAKSSGADPAALSEYQQELQEASPVTDEYIEQQLDGIDLRAVNEGAGLNMLGLIIRNRYYSDNHMSKALQGCYAGFDTLDLPQVVEGYKPRPLAGVWATPPFLHNGSVPNLYELLSPVAERSKRFFIGRREFDPVKVGYVTEPAPGTKSGFWFDTTLDGNRNTCHEFNSSYKPYDPTNPNAPKSPPGVIGPELTPAQRMDIIEYLKIKQDNPPSKDRTPIDCLAQSK
jgi:hypothetical protein